MNYQNELLSIANNYIKKNNLENYIEDIKFLKSQNTILPEDVVAAYYSKTRQIFYNLESALKSYDQFLDLVYYNYYSVGLDTPEKMNSKYAEDPRWAEKVNGYYDTIKES